MLGQRRRVIELGSKWADTAAIAREVRTWTGETGRELRCVVPAACELAWASLFAALCLALPSVGTPPGTQPQPAAPLEAIPAILDAFRSHRVVSFPDRVKRDCNLK
jgi:hypothetical protein